MSRILLAFALATVTACASPPANVAGSYTTSLTDDANGCMFMNWTGSTTGVPIDITQNGSAITGTVGGVAGAYLDTLFGSHVFTGSVSGTHIDMVLHGTRSANLGSNCPATLDAHASVDLNGDVLANGTITYSYATNHDATCPIYSQTCSSVQRFNGTRPPSR